MGRAKIVVALVIVILVGGCAHPGASYVTTQASGDSTIATSTPTPQVQSSGVLIPRGLPKTAASVTKTPSSLPTPTDNPKASRPSVGLPWLTPSPSAAAIDIPSERTEANADAGETPTPCVERQQTGPSAVPTSPPYEPIPLVNDARLEDLIAQFLGNEVDSYGILVKRLHDGQGVAINPDRQFYAASLFKLLVMYEVFKLRALGLLSFDERLTLTPPYLDYQLGELRWPIWSQVPIQELLEAMIVVSDNIAAMMLHDRVGGWNIIADTEAIGLEQTSISGEMPTSAEDMGALLEMMALGAAVDRESSQEMIDLLSRQGVNDRLPALLPEGTLVAHKTGNWDNATHDVGIVYAPSGPYVIAVLSEKPGDAKTIAELSLVVYNYFEGNSHP